ncbi:hypothetical protein OV208_33195 [Corallococcus sp. bb12-1]|uniref:PDZ domain-containing protein n=1 Tax=Corallococcus sp. bb12-1 TaxID=2996784 RepID=UPI00226DE63E|nr:PDZ domain-containing protein [Corallococcus sp. bb12-1]MCY1046213.1 hypothetical protein [Corallococcus sp. bb12-1]
MSRKVLAALAGLVLVLSLVFVWLRAGVQPVTVREDSATASTPIGAPASGGPRASRQDVATASVEQPMREADGRFELKDLAPVAHRLTAWSRGRELVDRQVTLASGKTQALGDWRLGPQRVEPGRLGLGFAMTGKDVIVSAILEGAQVAGLQVGDVVRSIDGAVVLDTGEARRRELGAPGSPAVLSFHRAGQPLSLTFTRAR